MPRNRCSFQLAGPSGVLGENNNKPKTLEDLKTMKEHLLPLQVLGKIHVPSKELIFIILMDAKDLSHVREFQILNLRF